MTDLRRTKGEPRVRYHEIVDEPTVDDPGLYLIAARECAFWHVGSVKLEDDADSGDLSLLQSGLAVVAPPALPRQTTTIFN